MKPAGRLLKYAQAREIRERRQAGEGGRALADEFGISEQLVCDIHAGRRYNTEAAERRAAYVLGRYTLHGQEYEGPFNAEDHRAKAALIVDAVLDAIPLRGRGEAAC